MGASTLDLPLYHGGGMSLLDCVSEGSNLFFLKWEPICQNLAVSNFVMISRLGTLGG